MYRKGGVFLFVPFVFATRFFLSVVVVPFAVVTPTVVNAAAAAFCGTSKTTTVTTTTTSSSNNNNSNSNNNKHRYNNSTRTRIPILQYHNDWVVINKPSGITVHRGGGGGGGRRKEGTTQPKQQHQHHQHQRAVVTTTVKRQLGRKVYPVHRLDHRTSGALILAFNSQTAGELHNFAIRKGTKFYIALLRGEFHPNQIGQTIVVNKPLKTTINSNNNNKQNENENGDVTTTTITKDAITNFIPLGTTKIGSFCGDENENNENENLYYYDRCSIVLCQPITGRTHQIRRHAYNIGHPIIGDTQHGDSKVNRYWRQYKSLNRLALHCWKINFDYYNNKRCGNEEEEEQQQQQHHECIAPLSPELIKVFETTHLSSVWKEALIKEPKLGLDHIDIKGGSHGRNYRKRQTNNQEVSENE